MNESFLLILIIKANKKKLTRCFRTVTADSGRDLIFRSLYDRFFDQSKFGPIDLFGTVAGIKQIVFGLLFTARQLYAKYSNLFSYCFTSVDKQNVCEYIGMGHIYYSR